MKHNIKSGDLVIVRARDPKTLKFTGEEKVVLCYDPTAKSVYDHGMHRSYRGIEMLGSDGRIVLYPFNEWSFDIIKN